MNVDLGAWRFLEELTWQHVALALLVVAVARLLSQALRAAIRVLAERVPARMRLSVLRMSPVVRLALGAVAIVLIVPMFLEPTVPNMIAMLASVGLALAFALKDYVGALIGGLVVVLEGAYQPGDWVEMAGTYGEVKSIDLRATQLVTADDTRVMIPHSWIWSGSIANATSGERSLLCVAEFFLDPDHDATAAQAQLSRVAESSAYRKAESPVVVIVAETPWGTKYRLKAYVKESREQYLFTTDLTIRGKVALRGMGARFARVPFGIASHA